MFGTIERENLIEAVSKIGNGRICRIGYRTELPVAAEYKKQGLRITKITERSVRVGVKYDHIKSVIERLNGIEKSKVISNNYIWIVPNKVKFNNKTQQYYLQVANVNKNHRTHNKYFIVWPEKNIYCFTDDIEDSPYKNCIINSYFTKKEAPVSGGEIQTISFKNIYKINKLEA